MNVLRASVTLSQAVLCLNVYLLCCGDTLQTLKIYVVVYSSILHMVHMVSVVILNLLRLVGDGNESYEEARQKEVRLPGIVIQEKSC